MWLLSTYFYDATMHETFKKKYVELNFILTLIVANGNKIVAGNTKSWYTIFILVKNNLCLRFYGIIVLPHSTQLSFASVHLPHPSSSNPSSLQKSFYPFLETNTAVRPHLPSHLLLFVFQHWFRFRKTLIVMMRPMMQSIIKWPSLITIQDQLHVMGTETRLKILKCFKCSFRSCW